MSQIRDVLDFLHKIGFDFSSLGTVTFWGMTIVQFINVGPLIKINPWTTLTNWISKIFSKPIVKKLDAIEDHNKTLEGRVNKLQNELISLNKTILEYEMVNSRTRILRFATEIKNNVKHSQEYFDQILSDIDTYQEYCDTHPEFKNNKAVSAIHIIITVYEKCLKDNDFL